jgi:hypothetical protein
LLPADEPAAFLEVVDAPDRAKKKSRRWGGWPSTFERRPRRA